MRPFRTDPPTDFRSYPLKILLDADIGKLHTQRIRDRQDDSDRLPLSMDLTDSCERRSSVSKCTPEWDEKLSFLATVRPKLSTPPLIEEEWGVVRAIRAANLCYGPARY